MHALTPWFGRRCCGASLPRGRGVSWSSETGLRWSWQWKGVEPPVPVFHWVFCQGFPPGSNSSHACSSKTSGRHHLNNLSTGCPASYWICAISRPTCKYSRFRGAVLLLARPRKLCVAAPQGLQLIHGLSAYQESRQFGVATWDCELTRWLIYANVGRAVRHHFTPWTHNWKNSLVLWVCLRWQPWPLKTGRDLSDYSTSSTPSSFNRFFHREIIFSITVIGWHRTRWISYPGLAKSLCWSFDQIDQFDLYSRWDQTSGKY